MLKKTLCAALCALILAIAPNVSAAPEIIEVDGVYMMGDNDAPKFARDAARAEAMRAATERAGIYIESTSEVQGYTLTRDEIRTVAAAVLRVLHEEATPELVGDAWRYRVHLVCSVDTEGIDLKELAGSKAELARLTRERDELKRANETLRARDAQADPTNAQGSSDSAKQNVIFADVEGMILRGENEHAIADLSLLLQDPTVTGDARAYAYVLRGRAYYDRHANALARADFTAAEHTPHTNSTYPIWRLYQYRGLIAYNEGHYADAMNDLMSAWEASDKTDDELWMSLRRAERRAEQDRRHAVRGDGGARSWNVVIVP
ncbi:hypothetical protein [uncultured Selenomonas sp.]|uniref:hypothetical protein n=1 Tax=uncultured Selenomonas sp. TaxID=159275 RepID=UPI0028EE2987|nr:hypothetical protein [uncultured Selenomonas sp.]